MTTRTKECLCSFVFILIIQVASAETETIEVKASAANPPDTPSSLSPNAISVSETLLQVDGNVSATSFSGDGSTLTNLSPSNLSAGIAPISISGEAASSFDIDCSNCVSEAELSFDPATQAELEAHAIGNPTAHHEPKVYTAGPGLALDETGTQISLSGFNAIPSNQSVSTLDNVGYINFGVSITIGSDGLGLISYIDQSGNLMVARCNDTDCLSADIHTLLTGGAISQEGSTSIAIGSDGLGLISFFDPNVSDQALDLKVAHCNDLQCSAADIYMIDNTASTVGKYSAITIGTDGLGLISYLDSSNSTLKAAHCNDIPCSSASTYHLTNGGVGSSIILGPDGLGIISHVNSGQLLVSKCNDVHCSYASTMSLEGPTGIVWLTEITIGSDGLPLVLYTEEHSESEFRLGVAHCTINCGTNAASIIDQAYGGSMTIGADGLALVSYLRAFSPFGLWVAHCVDLECSESTKVNTGIPTDAGISMTRGADNIPLIGLVDSPELKVVHCSNNFCIPYFRRR